MKTKLKKAIRELNLELNHWRVQQIMKLSDFEYKELIFETGMTFLENIYEIGTAELMNYSRCRHYWRWWVNQYNRWEFEYLNFYNQHSPVICDETLMIEMNALINDRITVAGFNNYLKLFHNVRL